MRNELVVRYVPSWLTNVMAHYGCGVDKFSGIVSKHDLKLYQLANTLVRGKFQQLGILADFSFPDTDTVGGHNDADHAFALYGQNPEDKAVAEFALTKFRIASCVEGEIYLIQDDSQEEGDLLEELLCALAMYKGKSIAYGSTCFKQYLAGVKTNLATA